MAANQKPIYATSHTTHDGKYILPGQRIDNVLPEHAVRSALEGGIASDSSAAADRARAGEMDRRKRVSDQIATRSEKREHNARRDGSARQLLKLPDGTFAYAD